MTLWMWITFMMLHGERKQAPAWIIVAGMVFDILLILIFKDKIK